MEDIFSMMLLEQFTAFAIIFATEGFNIISVSKKNEQSFVDHVEIIVICLKSDVNQ